MNLRAIHLAYRDTSVCPAEFGAIGLAVTEEREKEGEREKENDFVAPRDVRIADGRSSTIIAGERRQEHGEHGDDGTASQSMHR